MKKRLLAQVCKCVLMLLMAACSSSQNDRRASMRTVFASDPLTIDPRKNADIFSSYLQKMVFEGLTRLEEEGKIVPGLAEKVDVSEDGLTYRFHLRDAQWTDGHPITAYDFEYSWKKVLDPKFGAPSAFLFYPIRNAQEALHGQVSLDQIGIRAVDAKTFEVVLFHPTPYFLSLVSFCCFFPIPKHIDQANPHWHQSSQTSVVSNGPFRMVRWDRNNKISLEKNPAYWNRKNVGLQGLEVLIVPDEKTSLRMFEKNEVDVLNSFTTPLSVDELVHLKKNNQLKIVPNESTSFCSFNLNHPLLKNLSLRKALSLAINRPAIVQNITQMEEQPAQRYLTSVVAKGQPTPLIEAYNPEAAKRLFAQGVAELKKEGVAVDSLLKELTLSYENKELARRVVQAIQQEWKQLFGFEVRLRETDFKTHVASLEKRRYDIGYYYWSAHYLDPVSILDRFKHSSSVKNFPGFENASYAALLTQAQETNDPKKRERFMKEAESLMLDEMPLSPIFHMNQVVLKNQRFSNVVTSALGDILFSKVEPSRAAEKQ